jgi:DNA-binding CsgD family transcriptional regulator
VTTSTKQGAAPPPASDQSEASSSSSGQAGSASAAAAVQHRLYGKPLTAKQQRTWELKQLGKTREEIAAERGVSVNGIRKELVTIYRKLGVSPGKGGLNAETRAAEHVKPELAAAVIDAGTDPLQNVRDAMKAAGLPVATSEALLKRLRVKYYGAVQEVRALKTKEILELIEKKIHLGLSYLDDKVMAEASARDLMMGIGMLVEKRALLRGEPTAIISDHERQKIHELLPLAIAEAQRRGITVDGQVTEKTVAPA